MITYSVRYGKYNADPKKIKWSFLSDLREDGLLPSGSHRAFILTDGTRLEIPVEGMIFVFSKERQRDIDEQDAKRQKGEKEPS